MGLQLLAQRVHGDTAGWLIVVCRVQPIPCRGPMQCMLIYHTGTHMLATASDLPP